MRASRARCQAKEFPVPVRLPREPGGTYLALQRGREILAAAHVPPKMDRLSHALLKQPVLARPRLVIRARPSASAAKLPARRRRPPWRGPNQPKITRVVVIDLASDPPAGKTRQLNANLGFFRQNLLSLPPHSAEFLAPAKSPRIFPVRASQPGSRDNSVVARLPWQVGVQTLAFAECLRARVYKRSPGSCPE